MEAGFKPLFLIAILAACGDSSGPRDIPCSGPSFTDITIDGEIWAPARRPGSCKQQHVFVHSDQHTLRGPRDSRRRCDDWSL